MSTPPPSGPPPTVKSSPVSRIAKYFVAHKRDEFEAFGYDDAIHKPRPFLSPEEFLTFLRFERIAFTAPTDATPPLSMDGFITAANLVAAAIQKDHFSGKEILEFKETEHKALLGHVTDTKCRPDITAAFQSDWNEKGVTLWSCTQLAGERASKGKARAQQAKNAISYLHYLLLARPDLYVAQGLLIDKKRIAFLLGIGGRHIRQFDVVWSDKELYKLLYAFIYTLYDPDAFADKSYNRMKVNWMEETVEYSVQIRIPSTTPDGSTSTLDCTNFRAISARNPFTTRTHVLSNPSFKEKVNGKALTVLKDQLCRAGTRFDEETVLKAIHGKAVVPGVVEAVHHETIENCWSELTKREKHRFGLRQFGLPFASVPTPRKALEVLFDLLEVLRYLHSECHVIHRDISAGNVLYTTDSSGDEIAGAAKATVSSHSGQVPMPVFIEYLLGDSDDKQQTSMLLIDFNRGELLNEKQLSEHVRMDRTGTPIFIARAVEIGDYLPLPDIPSLPAVPQSPDVYTKIHPARITKIPSGMPKEILMKPERDKSPWRPGLEHDAESVFWLLLYWAMVVQPEKGSPEAVQPAAWALLRSEATGRDDLVANMAQGRMLTGLAHSTYRPLCPLIKDLAAFLVVDRQWLPESDVRNDPTYICEAFQRLILQFLLDHRHDDFMNAEARVQFRSVERMPQSEKSSASFSERYAARSATLYTEATHTESIVIETTSALPMAAQDRMRPSSPSDDARRKRRRLDIEGAGAENRADVEDMDDDDSDDSDYVPP